MYTCDVREEVHLWCEGRRSAKKFCQQFFFSLLGWTSAKCLIWGPSCSDPEETCVMIHPGGALDQMPFFLVEPNAILHSGAYPRRLVTSFCPSNKKLYVIKSKHNYEDNHLLSQIGLNKERLGLSAPRGTLSRKRKNSKCASSVPRFAGGGLASIELLIRSVWGLHRLASFLLNWIRQRRHQQRGLCLSFCL